MRELGRGELFGGLAQRKAWDARLLRHVGDLLLVVMPAPIRHQRVERVPVGDPIGLGRKARLPAPFRRAHHPQPGGPLVIVARRDRGKPVARRQDADRRAVAVGDPLARPAPPGRPGARQFGDRQGRQRLLDRHVDDGALVRCHHRVHAGASGGDAADKGGLFADRADRRLGEVIDLPRQHAGDAAREEQRQVGRRIVGLWPGLSVGRNQHQRRVRVDPAQRIGVAFPPAQVARSALAHDHVGIAQRVSPDKRLSAVQMRLEQRRVIGVDNTHRRPDIGEQPAADRGGQPAAELHDAKIRQHRHRRSDRFRRRGHGP